MAQLAQSTVPQMPLQISGTIVLIGAGRMGSAMLNGWIGLGLDPAQINVIEPQPAEGILGLAQRGLRLNSADLQASADAVVLAVKPQTAAEALARLPALLGASTVVISIMAGRTLGFLTGLLPPGTAIIRAMPNLPAAIGRGITVAVPNPAVTRAHRGLADRLLAAMGGVEWIADESLMDAVTAVSGSGPAYVFLLVESLVQAGVAAGLPPDLAARLARQTVVGSAELLHRSSEGATELRQNVTSPGGTTAAALAVLMGPNGLNSLMERAIAAAASRSRESRRIAHAPGTVHRASCYHPSSLIR